MSTSEEDAKVERLATELEHAADELDQRSDQLGGQIDDVRGKRRPKQDESTVPESVNPEDAGDADDSEK